MSFTCPRCGAISHNPRDAQERYCGRCHMFVDDKAYEEVGRRLNASELHPKQIVVIAPPCRPELITMHVVELRDNLVVFYSGVLNWHVINLVGENDELKDDQGRLVRVFEYLGEP